MSTLINCTPHPLRLVLPSGREVELAAATRPARLVGPHLERVLLPVEGEAVEVLVEPPGSGCVALPAPRPDTYFVVSRVVAERCRGRADLLVPATGPGEGAVRDGEGRIVAVTRLKRLLPGTNAQPAPR